MADKDLFRKGMQLEYATVGWTAIGSIAALAAGTGAGSIALIAFGLYNGIETVSTALLLWRLRRELAGQGSAEESDAAERKALFVVGVAFFLLALYLLNESGSRLYYREKADSSTAGLVLAALSLIIAVVLMVMKRRAATASAGGQFRPRVSGMAVIGFLSLILLLALGLTARFDWWWADPAAAFLMLPFIVREGWQAIEASKETGRTEVTGTRTPD